VRFASALHEGRPLAVALEGERAVPLQGVSELGCRTPRSLLRAPALDRARALPCAELALRPVVPRPGKVICVGLNYRAHVQETGREESAYPALFAKFASTLTGPFDAIPLPPESSAVDYEGELAVVIGERCRRVQEERALDSIAGLAVANDISMRDYQHRSTQWLAGKAWDATTPVGPELVTLDELGDPQALALRTEVNGTVVQESSTALMIFSIARLVSVISQFATLEPGDLILTGTPGGVGFRREPPLLLADGDVVAVEVQDVGRIENRIVAETPGA